MNGHDSGEVPPGDAEVETGEPIAALADLTRQPSPNFVSRVRRKVERRTVTGQFLSLAWHLPASVLMEVVKMIFESFGPRKDRIGGSR
jgi:hypothetical protein